MTVQVRQKLFEELSRAGALFVVLGVLVYFLYTEIDEVRAEQKECNERNIQILTDQLNGQSMIIYENNRVIDRNNQLFELIEKKL